MHRGLHGRGALFDGEPAGLVPRLVGLRPYDHLSTEVEHPGELPVLVLAGGRGLGKSAVLAAAWAAYTEETRRDGTRRQTPLALLDCEEEQFAGPPHGESPESWSPVLQALLVLAEQLTAPVRPAGSITFPRLTAGLVAVRANDWGGSDSERIRREIVRILLLNEGGPRLSHFAGRWAAKVAAKVVAAASGQGPLVSAVVEATLEALSERFTHHREQRPSTWYRTYPNAGGNAERGLILLSGQFRAGATSREHAERHLVRALLADLTAAYRGPGAYLKRRGRPLVLLDNAGAGPGPGLLGAVLHDRAEGIADRVVWIATLRGTDHPALPDAARRGLPEVARRSGWQPGATPSSRALLVTLPPLSPDDTLHLVGAVCRDAEVPARLPHAVHRLTGGNPLGIVLLAASAARQPEEAVSLGRLLTAPAAGENEREEETGSGRPAYRALLDRLVPADRLDELTVLAAAHDHDSACALAAARLPDDFGPAGVRTLRARLAEEGMPDAPGHFVGDPFVRTLLLLRLHHHGADHEAWRRTHGTLIGHYTHAGDDPGAARLRLWHELALGDADGAVAYLRDGFAVLDTRVWLDVLRFVASAPYFHAHDAGGRDFAGHDDRRARTALGTTDADRLPPADADALLHLRTRRLLHAVWQLTDPLVLPDPKVGERLRFELQQLSELRPAGGSLLFEASRGWPGDALAGRPLRLPDDDRAGHRTGEA
ncbi:hypothetical protein [Streptomyces tropicalis]|uniref:ATP-binding protein n=1 Tax=Streptomyces tropicalis TaxID=3034234 RepID=A0ABT6AB56_9ACTN|nr:hypothetical protein [Streptomyces tropicalis]MDF3301883.1 hypothetical protein [Streptomyces tropicalis]